MLVVPESVCAVQWQANNSYLLALLVNGFQVRIRLICRKSSFGETKTVRFLYARKAKVSLSSSIYMYEQSILCKCSVYVRYVRVSVCRCVCTSLFECLLLLLVRRSAIVFPYAPYFMSLSSIALCVHFRPFMHEHVSSVRAARKFFGAFFGIRQDGQKYLRHEWEFGTK